MLGKIGASTLARGKAGLSKFKVLARHELGKAARQTGKVGMAGGNLVGQTIARDTKRVVRQTANIASSFVKEDRANSLLGYRLKKRGVALAAGVGVLSTAAKETKSHFTEDLRGTQSGSITPYAPSFNSRSVGNGYGNYGAQAGATGDLVFALNRNRRG